MLNTRQRITLPSISTVRSVPLATRAAPAPISSGLGSRIIQVISNAASSPGTPARKKACRQPYAVANPTSTTGATKDPIRLEPKPCEMPIAIPRRRGSTWVAMSDWLSGITPPSATPMSSRVVSSTVNPVANPEPNEHKANRTVEAISPFLREPNRSATIPMPKAAMAHVRDNPPDSSPTCVLLNPSSGCTNGIRKLSALRSKRTNPKLRLSNAVSRHWYATDAAGYAFFACVVIALFTDWDKENQLLTEQEALR